MMMMMTSSRVCAGGTCTSLYELCWFVRPQRAVLRSRFGHKYGNDLAILVLSGAWFLHSDLEMVCFLEEATFSSLSMRPSN